MILCKLQRFDDLAFDGTHRIEGVHRPLEDHRNLLPADLAHLGFADLQQIPTVEKHLPVDDAPGLGQQAQQAEHDRGFAAAALADQAQANAPAPV